MQPITFTSGTFFRLKQPSITIPSSHAAHWPAPPRRYHWKVDRHPAALRANDPHAAALPRKPPTRWASSSAESASAFANWPPSTSFVPDFVHDESLRKRNLRAVIGRGGQRAWVEKRRLDWLSGVGGLHRSLSRGTPQAGFWGCVFCAAQLVCCCFSLPTRVRCRMAPCTTAVGTVG